MGNHHDSIALDWVRGEIQDTLTQSQQALEAFVDIGTIQRGCAFA